MIKVISFDLSTTCTGVVIALLDNLGNIKTIETKAIIPTKIDPTKFGFLKNRLKVNTKDFSSYLKYRDEIVTKTEKRKRDIFIKKESEKLILSSLSNEILNLFKDSPPDIVLMEANMSFRSIDVTRKLAEISGALQSLCVAGTIPILKINLHSARGLWDLSKESIEYARGITEKELKRIDLTKETLKALMLKEYKDYKLNENMTTDESDALVIFNYWYKSYREVK